MKNTQLILEIAQTVGLEKDSEGELEDIQFKNIKGSQIEQIVQIIVQKSIQEIKNKSMDSGDEWEQGLQIAENAIIEAFNSKELNKKLKP